MNNDLLNDKIKCLICLKYYKKKSKSIHNKTQHHILCEEIINKINFDYFKKNEIEKKEEPPNIIDFILNQI
jgi:hypothetical protein